MTRRERLERRAERRREWAAKREQKAAACARVGDEHRDENGRLDWALVTQPGHIPERDRINRAQERAWEHSKMAGQHRAAAAGTEQMLAGSIFSDDPDAVEALEAKAREIDEQCDAWKRANAVYKKAARGSSDPLRAGLLAVEAECGREVRRDAESNLTAWHGVYTQPFPPYALSNARANARRCRERIKSVRAQAEQTAKAEEAGGTVIERAGDDYVRVTFADFPGRKTIDALEAAGFHWSRPSWYGKPDRLPECVGVAP